MQVSWALVHGNEDRLEEVLPACLSAQELERYKGFRFPKRKQEWLLGRWVAKQLVLASVPGMEGVQAQQVEVSNEPQGSPFITLSGERFSSNVSISHREGSAFCAVAEPGNAIGVDLEKIEVHHPSFIADYFTPPEQAWVAACHPEDQVEKTALIWSAKEAVLKALGTGLRIDTLEIEILSGERDPSLLDAPGWQLVFARSKHLPAGDQPLFFLRTGDFILTLLTLPSVPASSFREFGLSVPQ